MIESEVILLQVGNSWGVFTRLKGQLWGGLKSQLPSISGRLTGLRTSVKKANSESKKNLLSPKM
jgi:hypothetical protein